MNRFGAVAFLLLSMGTSAALGAAFDFSVLPSGGQISGSAGNTVGWGYSITNPTANWLEITNISSDIFTQGTPDVVFDFPILAPGDTVTVAWSIGTAGLYQFTWDSTAPAGSSNSGQFVLNGEFWSALPYSAGATDLGAADAQSASYTVTLGSISGVPEPAPIGLLVIGLGGLAGLLRWKAARLS